MKTTSNTPVRIIHNQDVPVWHQAERAWRWLQSLGLLASMGLTLGVAGWLLAGELGLLVVALFSAVNLGGPLLRDPLDRGNRFTKLDRYNAPSFVWAAEKLAKRAQLPISPEVYMSEENVPNAYAVQRADRPMIVMSKALLSMLNEREILGVMAHEIAHFKNKDLGYLSLMIRMQLLTHRASLAGMLILLSTLPLVLLGVIQFSLVGAFILAILPKLGEVLFFSFSRVREFQADLDAVQLTGDPSGLASALSKLERLNQTWTSWLGWRRSQEGNQLYRTHPSSKERILRLQRLAHISI